MGAATCASPHGITFTAAVSRVPVRRSEQPSRQGRLGPAAPPRTGCHFVKHALYSGRCDEQQQLEVITRQSRERVRHAAGRQDKASGLTVNLGITDVDPNPALQYIPRFVLPIMLVQRRVGPGHVLLNQGPGPFVSAATALLKCRLPMNGTRWPSPGPKTTMPGAKVMRASCGQYPWSYRADEEAVSTVLCSLRLRLDQHHQCFREHAVILHCVSSSRGLHDSLQRVQVRNVHEHSCSRRVLRINKRADGGDADRPEEFLPLRR